MMEDRHSRSPQSAAIFFFAGLTLLALLVFGALFRPLPAQLQGKRSAAYEPEAMRTAVTPERLERYQAEVAAFGNRFPGTPGHDEARRYLKAFYEARGFTVEELPVPTVVPVVERATLKVGEGVEIAVSPVQPNHFQPDTTGEEGITGRLLLFDDATMATEKSFGDVIAVVDASRPPAKLGLNSLNYLRLGVRALLIFRSGETPVDWEAWTHLIHHQPVSFPRAFVEGDLRAYLGKSARLDLRVRYRQKEVATLIATRKPGDAAQAGGRDEAVVLTTHYDTFSILPWYHAPVMQTAQLAQHLALVEGIAAYSGSRDLIVIASGAQFNALAGEAAALQFVGPGLERHGLGSLWEEELRKQTTRLEALAAADTGTLKAGPWTRESGHVLNQEFKYVMEAILYEKTQARVRAKAEFEALPQADLQSDAYRRFSALNRECEAIRGMLGVPIGDLLASRAGEIKALGVFPRLQERLAGLKAYHAARVTLLERGLALHRLTSGYRNLFQFSSLLLPGPDSETEAATWIYGTKDQNFEKQDNQYGALFRDVDTQVAMESGAFTFHSASKEFEKRFFYLPNASSIWSLFNYPACTIVHTDRTDLYQNLTNPFLPMPDHGWRNARQGMDHASRYLLALVHGAGTARPPRRLTSVLWNFGGRVLVSGVGQAVLPSFPLANAILGGKQTSPIHYQSSKGYYPLHLTQTDPYGEYYLPYAPLRLMEPGNLNLQAFDYDEAGRIRAAKDEGLATQKLFRSMDFPHHASMRNITLVVFPASGVTIPSQINPQTLAPYASISFLRTQGLTTLARSNVFPSPEITTAFMEPDTRFLLAFNSGSPENELVQSVRAFALGAPDPNQARDIGGRGYIAAKKTIFHDVYPQTAQSMERVNTSRADLQRERHMLDPMTQEYLETSQRFLRPEPEAPWLRTLLNTWDSITYSIIIHPILRSNISQAILSVIWYLGLLVPFVFFFEKLVFGFTDIRHQLAAQSGIFLLSFALLKWLHPAFGMIRSSLIILLGFAIFLICAAMTVLFISKASENLELLRRKQSRVKAADVNPLGILATSFLLGLNNMHRRKVRTGLTCATLVLITFAMIAFTSIYEDFEEQETVVGPAPYQGLLIRKEKSAAITPGEAQALDTKYASRYPVLLRHAIVGRSNWLRESLIPSLEVVHAPEHGMARRVSARTVLFFEPGDPIAGGLPIIAGKWLPENTEGPPRVLISDRMAQSLGIEPAQVENGAPLQLNGRALIVCGLFDAGRLDHFTDLDGRSILPFDVEGLQSFEITTAGFYILADESDARVPAADAIIAPASLASRETGGTETRTMAAVVNLEGVAYREARSVIRQYVEQSGLRTVYGLDGAAAMAVRRRHASVEGLVDLIIPLFIAAITVLNTMKGSVYERRDELYVYNAVGIAPRYIFAMFFAESLVYAIVGSVLGYFLSQGVGAALTALDLTGGLNMTFASLNSVYASLAVMGAVFFSTWFPARTAVEIAATSEDSGWKLPEAEGGSLEFDLPFLFDARERLAVLAFFRHFLLNHTEGDGGIFQSSMPRSLVESEGGAPDGAPVPGVGCEIWLKPFDLGVSQELRILTPTDPQSGEYVARLQLVHRNGTRDAWNRLNRGFIATLRRQFLHWRAVSPQQKELLLAETRAWFEEEAI